MLIFDENEKEKCEEITIADFEEKNYVAKKIVNFLDEKGILEAYHKYFKYSIEYLDFDYPEKPYEAYMNVFFFHKSVGENLFYAMQDNDYSPETLRSITKNIANEYETLQYALKFLPGFHVLGISFANLASGYINEYRESIEREKEAKQKQAQEMLEQLSKEECIAFIASRYSNMPAWQLIYDLRTFQESKQSKTYVKQKKN